MSNEICKLTFRDKLWLLVFVPVFFTTSGIYRGQRTNIGDIYSLQQGGLVLPLTFFIGVLIALFIILNFLRNGKAYVPAIVRPVLILFLVSTAMGLIGWIISGTPVPFILSAQFSSGYLGIVLALWFFKYRQMDFITACGFISKIYIVNMLLHMAYSYYMVGLVSTVRGMVPETPLWGINQIFVYYPLIISAVFMFALPYWLKYGKKVFVPVYLFVFSYVYLCEVKAATISFVSAMVFYFAVVNKDKRVIKAASVLIISLLMWFFSGHGRISSHMFSDATRWAHYAAVSENIVKEPAHFIYGNLFGGTEITDSGRSILGPIGGSVHNQYVDYFQYGGIILLSAYALFFIAYYKYMMRGIDDVNKNPEQRFIIWWLGIVSIQAIVDFNVDTPLRSVNPAIIYWFYWFGALLTARSYGKQA
ncbi:MAG: hypothetical protein HQL08_00950 [Nitrospirae bacterium]|nr:hypothetical protein [Nitrospirota bacterium]